MKKYIYLVTIVFLLLFYSCEDILRLPEFAPFSLETRIDSIFNRVGDRFGASVCIDNTRAIIGMPYSDLIGDNYRAACIYEKNEFGFWEIAQVLFPSGGDEPECFGWSVSIYGDYAIVGTPKEDTGGENAGAVYLFERDNDTGNWIQKQSLYSPVPDRNDHFSCSVSISNNYVIIGAYGENAGAYQSGAAYIFEQDNDTGNWIQKGDRLFIFDAQEGDIFGSSVSLSGDYAIVGSPGVDINGIDAGAVYVFERDVFGYWIKKASLYGSDAQAGDYFGLSVSISGNYATIGAPYHNGGSAYLFERNQDGCWNEVRIFHSIDEQVGEHFGHSVHISSSRIIAGIPGKDDDSGGAYIYKNFYFTLRNLSISGIQSKICLLLVL